MEFDPDATFGFEIQFEDEIPKYVTLDELKELIKEEPYQRSYDKAFLNFKKDQKTGLKYVDIHSFIFPEWVSSHILVNTCMEDPDSYDWYHLTDMYNYQRIADFVYIWVHPYTWISKDDRHLHDCLILGKVATMVTDKGRVDMFLYDWLSKRLRERVLFLADRSPRAVADLENEGQGKILKGMLSWDLITTDARNYLKQFMYDELESQKIEYFHIEAFRENIQFIAQERGGKVAAELLRQLRKDWKAIVTWKCFGIDKITPEQVEAFRQCLFEGMDYYLEQWESETPKEQSIEPIKCRYVDLDKLAEVGIHTQEEFTRSLRQACEQDAPTLGAFLKKNFKLGYLDFHGDGKKKIYEHLKECFPHGLNYSYPNFTQYFD